MLDNLQEHQILSDQAVRNALDSVKKEMRDSIDLFIPPILREAFLKRDRDNRSKSGVIDLWWILEHHEN